MVLVGVGRLVGIEAEEVELLARGVGRPFLEPGSEEPLRRAGPRQDGRRARGAVVELEGQSGAGRVGKDGGPLSRALVRREKEEGLVGLQAVAVRGEMDLDGQVRDLALLEGQGLQAVGDRRRGRELVERLADDRLLELEARRGQERVEVLFEAFVGRPGLAPPDLPEIRPAQEEGAPGLEEGLVRAGDAGDPRPAVPGEEEDAPLVRGERGGIEAPLFEGLAGPGEVAADQDGQGR